MKPRILRNAHGSSPGNGAPPVAPPAQPAPAPAPQAAPAVAAPPAAPASPAPTPAAPAQGTALTPEAIAQIAEQVRNGVFADLRRAGVLGTSRRNAQPAASPAPAGGDPAAPGAAPQPAAVDAIRLRELDRAITRGGHATRLDAHAYRRIERAFVDELPEDAEAWVADYFAGLGLVAPAAQAAPTSAAAPAAAPAAQAAPAPTGPSFTGRAAPSPTTPALPLEQQDLVTMSPSDRDALLAQKTATLGRDQALAWYAQTLIAQQSNRKLVD